MLQEAPPTGRRLGGGGLGSNYFLELGAPLTGGSPSANLAGLVASNFIFYLRRLFGNGLFPCPRPWDVAPAVLGAAATVAGARSMNFQGWRRPFWLHWGLYLAVVLVWFRQSDRYLLPMLPFAAALAAQGAAAWGRRVGNSAVLGVGLLALFGAGLASGPLRRIVEASLSEGNSVNAPPPRTCEWIRRETRPSDIFAAEMDARLFLYTRRKALRLPPIDDPAAQQALDRRLLASPLFVKRFADPFERSAVFAVARPAYPAAVRL